ncbi:hypothetical protein TNCV_606021 [Trichonephila clavipes]|nr:hypothetical protein TNCV_606021 [Trichonephila clavipes]
MPARCYSSKLLVNFSPDGIKDLGPGRCMLNLQRFEVLLHGNLLYEFKRRLCQLMMLQWRSNPEDRARDLRFPRNIPLDQSDHFSPEAATGLCRWYQYNVLQMMRAVGSPVVRALDSRLEGMASVPDATKYPPRIHGVRAR